MPVKDPWDCAVRPPIKEAIRRACEKFHVPQSVFVLHALQYYCRFQCSQHPFENRIAHFETTEVSKAKNRTERARAKILGLLTPSQRKTKQELALERAKKWLEENDKGEQKNDSEEGIRTGEDIRASEGLGSENQENGRRIESLQESDRRAGDL